MSDKNLDDAGRWRSKTVAFRVSPEEAGLIDAQVAMSGLTKQDYITARLLEESVAVKAFADERDVAMVVVHHTRKMGDGDVFNTISGSNGLMGCADETMVLRRKARGRAPISRVCAVESRHVYEMGYLLEMACKAACLTLRHRYCPRDSRGVNPWFNYF